MTYKVIDMDNLPPAIRRIETVLEPYAERAHAYGIEARRNAQYAVALLRGKGGRGMNREAARDKADRMR